MATNMPPIDLLPGGKSLKRPRSDESFSDSDKTFYSADSSAVPITPTSLGSSTPEIDPIDADSPPATGPAEATAPKTAPETKEKRGRGRPRKTPLTAEEAEKKKTSPTPKKARVDSSAGVNGGEAGAKVPKTPKKAPVKRQTKAAGKRAVKFPAAGDIRDGPASVNPSSTTGMLPSPPSSDKGKQPAFGQTLHDRYGPNIRTMGLCYPGLSKPQAAGGSTSSGSSPASTTNRGIPNHIFDMDLKFTAEYIAYLKNQDPNDIPDLSLSLLTKPISPSVPTRQLQVPSSSDSALPAQSTEINPSVPPDATFPVPDSLIQELSHQPYISVPALPAPVALPHGITSITPQQTILTARQKLLNTYPTTAVYTPTYYDPLSIYPHGVLTYPTRAPFARIHSDIRETGMMRYLGMERLERRTWRDDYYVDWDDEPTDEEEMADEGSRGLGNPIEVVVGSELGGDDGYVFVDGVRGGKKVGG